MTVLPEVHRSSKCWRYFVLLKFVLYRILGFWLAKIHTVQSNWNALNVSRLWLVCCNSLLPHVRIHIINQSLTLIFLAPVFYLKKAKIFTVFPLNSHSTVSLSTLRVTCDQGFFVLERHRGIIGKGRDLRLRWGSLRRIIYIFCSPPGLFNSPVIWRFFFLFLKGY